MIIIINHYHTIIYMYVYMYIMASTPLQPFTSFHLAPGFFPRLQSLAQDAASTAAHEESGAVREPQVTRAVT